jgi:hypothetical protein
LESSGYGEILCKIRVSKDLGVKIRETKDLAPDGFGFHQTVAVSTRIARLKSSVKVGCHTRSLWKGVENCGWAQMKGRGRKQAGRRNPRPFGLAQGRLFENREDRAGSVRAVSAREGGPVRRFKKLRLIFSGGSFFGGRLSVMDKRYQVFVSSTYADLKEERQAVFQTVIEADCIPAGMELFPAVDQQQFDFIKRVIDDCDYYLLIIAGRYGSVSETGLSYTEQEYDYAVSRGLRVIALVHANPDDIPLGKSEKDPASQGKLKQFRDKVCKGRLVRMWKDKSELPNLVLRGLLETIKQFPAVGWVRADKVANVEVLGEINELRKRNGLLENLNARLEGALAAATAPPALPDLAGLDEEVNVHGSYWNRNAYRNWYVTTTWRKIFAYVSPYLVSHPNAAAIKAILLSALFKDANVGEDDPENNRSLDDQDFQTIGLQLKALGLVSIDYTETTSGGMGLFWSFTPKGEQLMVELRAVRSKRPSNSKG